MAVLRLAGGSDVMVKLSVQEVVTALQAGKNSDAFVELQGEDAPILVRPSSVLAIIEDGKRGTTGFRIAAGESSSG